MVNFVECDPSATDADVDALEQRLGFRVPTGIRRLLTTANGGRPEPNIFRNSCGSTDVSECLALRHGKGNIWWMYDLLVLTKQAAPKYFLPFAVDSGGNAFLVDCLSENVHILLHDPCFKLCSLGVNLENFWLQLQEK